MNKKFRSARCFCLSFAGWPRFGSVRLRFADGTVRAVPVIRTVPLGKGGFLYLSTISRERCGFGSNLGSWKRGAPTPPNNVINVGPHHQSWLCLLHLLATHKVTQLQHEYTTTLILQIGTNAG